MQIGVIGINHKSAELNLREEIGKAIGKYFGIFSYQFPFVLLSTCNRTEIYFSSDDLASTHTFLFSILRGELHFEFEHKIYAYFGADCFFHLAKVTSGLDSAIIGETEIQGQVKHSYEMAAKVRTLNRPLHFLFQKSLKIGKEIRSKCHFISPPIEDLIYFAVKSYFQDLEKRKILVIGLSEVNLKVIKKFENFDLTLCNRTLSKTLPFGKKTIPFLDHQKKLFAFDLIIYGTKAEHFLLRNWPFSSSSKKLIIDTCVPRNVNPTIESELLKILNIDQITQYANLPNEKDLTELMPEVERQIALFNKREAFYTRQVLVSA